MGNVTRTKRVTIDDFKGVLVLCLAYIPISDFSSSNTPEDAIQARQEIMKYIGSQMLTHGAIQSGGTEFDPSLTKDLGQAIYSMSYPYHSCWLKDPLRVRQAQKH